MAIREVRLYRNYNWIDKDPVIDEMRTVFQDEGLIKKLALVHELSGVATATMDNWFNGSTRKPQNTTIEAVMRSLGYSRPFTKTRDIDIEKERKAAATWLARQNTGGTKKKRGAKSNGHSKGPAK